MSGLSVTVTVAVALSFRKPLAKFTTVPAGEVPVPSATFVYVPGVVKIFWHVYVHVSPTSSSPMTPPSPLTYTGVQSGSDTDTAVRGTSPVFSSVYVYVTVKGAGPDVGLAVFVSKVSGLSVTVTVAVAFSSKSAPPLSGCVTSIPEKSVP